MTLVSLLFHPLPVAACSLYFKNGTQRTINPGGCHMGYMSMCRCEKGCFKHLPRKLSIRVNPYAWSQIA